MAELFILFLAVYVGYQIGVSVTAWRLRDIIYKEAKAKGIVTERDKALFEEPEKPSVFKLWIEKSHDILYLYDYDKDTFVCQASTVEDLAKLALQYKNIKYAAVVMDDQSFMFVNGAVKTKL